MVLHVKFLQCMLFPFVRFKYENSGKLTDASSPPTLLQSVHQLIEVSQTLLYYLGHTHGIKL